MRYTAAVEKQILERYRVVGTLSATAESLGLSRTVVTRVIKESGLHVPRPGKVGGDYQAIANRNYPSGISGRGELSVIDGVAIETFADGKTIEHGRIWTNAFGYYTCGNGRFYSFPLPAAFDLALQIKN